MGNPEFLSIKDAVTLTDFSVMPWIGIEFYQQHSGKRYYRLKCVKDQTYSPSDFPTTYIYLGSFDTSPQWIYTHYFQVQSVKNSSLVNTSFEALFTRYSGYDRLRVSSYLQSSATGNFSSYEESSESRFLDIRIKGENFAPTWTRPTWIDHTYSSNPGVRTLTGSNQKGVQGVSRIDFTIAAATAKYGTSISKYTLSIKGGFSKTLTPAELSAAGGTVSLYLSQYNKLTGNVSVTFTVEDSRGMTRTYTSNLTIVSYREPTLALNNTHRQGGTGSTVVLDFQGSWNGSPLQNSDLTCTGITAYEEGQSSAAYMLVPSLMIGNGTFSYQAVWNNASFNSKKAYTITAVFTDTVKTVTLTFPIPVGTPVLAIRNHRVGINNPSPDDDFSLDVTGIIAQNAYPVIGYRGFIGTAESANLNDYTESGFYIYTCESSEVKNFPNNNSNMQLLLLVICAKGYANQNYGVQKAWDPSSGNEYTRTFHGSSFKTWKKVTVT